MDLLSERQKTFFANCKKTKPEEREVEFEKIKEEYRKVIEDASEKIELLLGELRRGHGPEQGGAKCDLRSPVSFVFGAAQRP